MKHMFKRFRWVAVVTGLVAIVVALMASGTFTRGRSSPNDKRGTDNATESETDRTRMEPRSVQEELAGHNLRESRRHAAGEVEKYQKRPLEELVAEQELIVERKRAALGKIVRTKGIIYVGPDSYSAAPEEIAKGNQADEEFINAKREFEAAQTILQSMKIQLMGKQIAEKMKKQ